VTSSEECAHFLEQIVYLLDNELDEASCTEVRIHLDSCHPCLEKYDVQRTVKAIVARSCAESAPEELRERVRLRIRQVQFRLSE
jgi:mycothiol system anti-sigma-R factor